MRILLVNPWITDFAAFDFWDRPIGLLYIASFLRQRGHEIRLIDCMDRFQNGYGFDIHGSPRNFNTGKFYSEIIEKPSVLHHVPRNYRRYGIPVELFETVAKDGFTPDAVLVSSLMTYWYPGVFDAIHIIHQLFPDIPVLLGGIYARLCIEHALSNSNADRIITAATPSEIVNIVEDTIGTGSNGPDALDEFPAWPEPAWDLYREQRTASILTARGCPFRCAVCASHLLMDRFERRHIDSVITELEKLAGRGVEDVAFADDALLLNAASYALPLFERISGMNLPLRLHTPNGLHVREITPEIAQVMKRAGVNTVRLSLETSSANRITDFSCKVSPADFKSAALSLFDAGFTPGDIGAYVMAGLPGQTHEEVENTIEFSWECGVRVNPALFSPVPGTEAYTSAIEYGMIQADDDPLLQNNTLRTIDWFNTYPGGYRAFRRKITINNESLCHRYIPSHRR